MSESKGLRVLVVFGTRPECIKMAPVVAELRRHGSVFDTRVCVTGQHIDLLDPLLAYFRIVPNVHLRVMREASGLADLTCAMLSQLDRVFEAFLPQIVVVHGDTSTTLAATLAAFYRGVPVAHVEAGLRTGRLDAPFPEEGNRRVCDLLARHHFAPTLSAKANLIAERVDPASILVAGNTGIDALFEALRRAQARAETHRRDLYSLGIDVSHARPRVLVTAHRRENHGSPLREICRAVRQLAESHPTACFVFPVHPNPNVQRCVEEFLRPQCPDNLVLMENLPYEQLAFLLQHVRIVLTDSGGLQEEAPALGKPVLVLRSSTERPEAVENGAAELIGDDMRLLRARVAELLRDGPRYRAMASAGNPFGDGRASRRIVEHLAATYSAESDPRSRLAGFEFSTRV